MGWSSSIGPWPSSRRLRALNGPVLANIFGIGFQPPYTELTWSTDPRAL
jgi:hypothetical protein